MNDAIIVAVIGAIPATLAGLASLLATLSAHKKLDKHIEATEESITNLLPDN